jgi:tetratricopeptide (TPR) repeat protein
MADLLAEARSAAAARAAVQGPPPDEPRYEDEWIRVGLADAERALLLRPGDAEALELRGALRYLWWLRGYVVAPESLAAAERDLRAAVTAAPPLARAWFRLSQVLRFTGRFAEAQQAAERALAADAFLLEVRPAYATLYFAALNLGHYDDARAWCMRARSRFPADVEFAHCELRILGWSGRGRAAIARARRLVDSLEAGRSDARAGSFAADRRLLVAAIYARSGRPTVPARCWRRARRRHPGHDGAVVHVGRSVHPCAAARANGGAGPAGPDDRRQPPTERLHRPLPVVRCATRRPEFDRLISRPSE